ncbi:MAG: hypothetical protein IJW88_07880 [Alistipes sp.]|nr:hypothetical protein [Alistipes sp.]
MKAILNLLAVVVAGAALFVSCGVSKPAPAQPKIINLALVKEAQSGKYVNLDYGIRLNVDDARADQRLVTKYDASATSLPSVSVTPNVRSFVSESVRRYMRTMGFNLDADVATDYMMNLTIKDFNLGYLSGIGWSATVMLEVCVYDSNRQLVYPKVVATGRANMQASAYNFMYGNQVINTAYANALEDIDWDRIAYFLKKASTPKLEANKQVQGEGNTALESTVIRWFFDSTPRGADVYMRVVSSTPDVKNTNSNYVGTTPYEATEAFDIKGLTYNNSGNVQIEVMVEKAGYAPSMKRFNLRQVIDQKEISSKFNLVKNE